VSDRLPSASVLDGLGLLVLSTASSCWYRYTRCGTRCLSDTIKSSGASTHLPLRYRGRAPLWRRTRHLRAIPPICSAAVGKNGGAFEHAMDRSKRANNPQCFDENGRWKKGAKDARPLEALPALSPANARSVNVVLPPSARSLTVNLPIAFSIGTGRSRPKSCPIEAFQRNWQERQGCVVPEHSLAFFATSLRRPGGELVEFGTRHRGRTAKILIGLVAIRAGGAFRAGNTDPINAKDCNLSIAPAMARLASRGCSPVEAGVLSAGSSERGLLGAASVLVST
jgi:hypothetical protein